MSRRKPTLSELVREAREERVPDVDWGKIEEPLFARVAEEARVRAAVEKYEGKRRTWVTAGVVLAIAASVPLFYAGTRDATLDVTAEARAPSGGEMSWKDPNAQAHVTRGGVAHDATAGESLAEGDVLEPKSGRVVFARTEPTGVTWDAEDNARVEVRATRGTLILALTRGAVEAQVAPVANGEAFAVDVDGTRVAVHGTHLRVARDGARATVDLREGVISIGLPPRSGSTYGDLVTAPAHVEFDPSDPHGTLKVSHEIGRVRVAANLEPPRQDAREMRRDKAADKVDDTRPSGLTSPASLPGAPRPSAPAGTPVSALRPSAVAPLAPVSPAATPTAVPTAAASPAAVVAPVPPLPTPLQVDPDPPRTIRDAVRACESTHVAHATGVIVTVSSVLRLRVGASGMVEGANFDPPLAPDVQQCAVKVIYGTRFAAPGNLSVPIDFTP